MNRNFSFALTDNMEIIEYKLFWVVTWTLEVIPSPKYDHQIQTLDTQLCSVTENNIKFHTKYPEISLNTHNSVKSYLNILRNLTKTEQLTHRQPHTVFHDKGIKSAPFPAL